MKKYIEKYASTKKQYKSLIKMQNQREIKNPYKVNGKLYIVMILASVLGMVYAFSNPCGFDTNVTDVIKNLSYGCFASTLVALLIEIASVRDKNKKVKDVYNAVYIDLHLEIKAFLQCWSELCCVSIKNRECKLETHTWKEWYEIYKKFFSDCDKEKQIDLAEFLVDRLGYFVERLLSDLCLIEQQQYLLKINEVFNNSIKYKLLDLKFECEVLKSTLEREGNKPESLFEWLDAINTDFENYVNNWIDIRYLNYYKQSPFSFDFDYDELETAIKNSEKQKTDFGNK